MSSVGKVLVVDDDHAVRDALSQTLELAEFEVIAAGSFVEGKDHITQEFQGVILSDMRMPGRDGFHLLDYTLGVDDSLPVILLTGEGDIPMAVKAMSMGAFGFLEKPCAPDDLTAVIARAQKARDTVLENRRLKAQAETGDAAARMLFGHSTLADEMRRRVRAVARTRAEVLITGPPGSGMAKVAEVIHLLACGAGPPFVKRPAAALDPAGVMQAFDAATGGSLFLDEVTALDPASQFALLERLDEGAPARLISGSSRELQSTVAQTGFSADLAVRLDVMHVRIPALAERKEDIPVLFRHYVAQACEQAALAEPEISPDLIARLMEQDWPGNARSLRNAAMRFAMGMSDVEPAQEMGLAEQLAQVERALLVSALERAGGRAVEAAEALKLPRKTLYDKLSKHQLKPEDYRHPTPTNGVS